MYRVLTYKLREIEKGFNLLATTRRVEQPSDSSGNP